MQTSILNFKFFKTIALSNGLGLLLSFRYDEVTWLPAFLLFLFTSGLIHMSYFSSLIYWKRTFAIITTIMVPAVYFFSYYSTFSLLLFIPITILLSFKKQFTHFNMEKLYIIIETFIFTVILNSFSFYTQTFFLNGSTVIFLIAVFLVKLYIIFHLSYNRSCNSS